MNSATQTSSADQISPIDPPQEAKSDGISPVNAATSGTNSVPQLETNPRQNGHYGPHQWSRDLTEAIRDPEELLCCLGLDGALIGPARRAGQTFPLFVTRSYVERMSVGDVNDPLLKQVLPLANELTTVAGFLPDAVDDAAARRAPGLLQKYAGRALLMTTGACAIHCRYCFRREYPYANEPRRLEDWEPAFTELQHDTEIHEIILSGGDPLMLSDARLRELTTRLDAMPHLRRLRVHSRLPIVLPSRMHTELTGFLQSLRLTTIFVVHANHAKEIVGECARMLRQLVRDGFTVLNQAVLLKGVNDSVDAQAELCERLADLGVLPYYLHQLDRVRGTAHFEVTDQTAIRIVDELRTRLPGYAVPQLVREIPGQLSKTPVQAPSC